MNATVIVDCPHCHTSNSTEGSGASETTNTGVGTMVVCRGCGQHFHAPNQVNEVGTNTTQVVLPERSKNDNALPSASVTDADLRIPQAVGDDATSVINYHDDQTKVGTYPLPPEAYQPNSNSSTHPGQPLRDSTNVMQADLLQAELRRMQAPRGEPPAPSSSQQYPLVKPWLRRFKQAKQVFLQQTLATRALLVGGAMAALVIVTTALRLAFHGHGEGAFVAMAQPLLTEPVRGIRPQRAQGTILRGAQVAVFDAVGPYIMIRDSQGRVGYVLRDTLASERPASQPEAPFVDCMPSAMESDRHGCEGRADEQWGSCRDWCEKGNGTEKCIDDCRGQYELCRATCRGEAVRPEPSPPPASFFSRPVQPRTTEPPPAARPADSHASKPKKTSTNTNKKHKH